MSESTTKEVAKSAAIISFIDRSPIDKILSDEAVVENSMR